MLMLLQIIETEEDRSKFERIYSEYRGLMYHVAFKYLCHEQDAEDAVQQAFVKIAENIKIIEPVSPKTKQLVVTIVESRAIDMLRARSRRAEAPFADEVYAIPTQPPADGYLAQCIFKLPTLQRQVIVLKYYHGYDLREIAKLLGISLSWAQKLDQRAKQRLKALYGEGEETP